MLFFICVNFVLLPLMVVQFFYIPLLNILYYLKLAFKNWNNLDSANWVDAVLFWHLVNFKRRLQFFNINISNCWYFKHGPISKIVFRDIQALAWMCSGNSEHLFGQSLWAPIWYAWVLSAVMSFCTSFLVYIYYSLFFLWIHVSWWI